MGFERPSLSTLISQIQGDYVSRYQPIEPSVRYDLVQVLTQVDAGIYHQLNGDLVFLSRQIFPDTAEADYLRAHWSDRVPPLNATRAVGEVVFEGPDGVTIPSGTLLKATNDQTYFTFQQVVIEDGVATANVKASEVGDAGNLAAGSTLTISSTVPAGVDTEVTVGSSGLSGGVDAESDATYLSRVLLYLQTGERYGKPGDFAAWAIDATAEVDRAWERKNWSVFGALLILVAGGNQIDGLVQVANLDAVAEYISSVAPPTTFAVRTLEFVELNPTIALDPSEDSTANRETVTSRILNWMNVAIEPGSSVTSGQIRDSFVDGVDITSATVELAADPTETTQLQIPILGTITWN